MKRNSLSCLILSAAALVSCSVYETLDPCPKGVSLRFVYDYNMEYADAFSEQVDCLTLYVYDGQGNYVMTRTVTGDELQDENYRMVLDLPEGDYRFVAYGGLACDKHSFAVEQEPAPGSTLDDLEVAMELSGENVSKELLHDLFWGRLDARVEGELYRDETLYLMKNTNNVRIVIQQADTSSDPLEIDDFEISITDDNTRFAADNSLLAGISPFSYEPWTQGDGEVVGESESGKTVSAAYAEFSISRLMTTNNPRLTIYSHQQQETVVDIPLNKYLLLLKSEKFAGMADQEYLDRENLWSIIFLLNDYTWHDVRIVINDWTVRQDNIQLK